MSAQKFCSIASGLVFVLAFLPYIVAILRRETVPTKSTWIVWASVDTVTALSMWNAHSLNGQMIGALTGAYVVTFLAIRYGESSWTRTDRICLVGAGIGLLCLLVWKNPTWGLIFSLSALTIGAIPTMKSAWKDPLKEDKKAWIIWVISCALAVIAIPQWTVADALQPMTFLLVDTVILMIICFSPNARLYKTLIA